MSHSAATETAPADPLLYDVPLPLSAVFHPMGYPVRIETNSMDIVRAADEVWSLFPCLRQTMPVSVRLAVAESTRTTQRIAPVHRAQGHLLACTMGPDDYAVADLAGGFVFGWLTPASVADRSWFRYHILEPLVYLTLQCLYCTPVHAACVARGGRALLLCGDSGAGKTCLAYACARRGWTYLSDDATVIDRGRPELIATGRPHHVRFRSSASSLFPELAQFPVVERPNGKPDIEVESAALGLPIALEAPIAAIVFLKRGSGSHRGADSQSAAPRLISALKSDALDHLQQVVCFGDDRVRREMRRSTELLAGLPTVELHYSAFDEAESRLSSFICDL